MPAWVTEAQVKQAVADALNRDISELTPRVDRIVTAAVERAQGQIRGAFFAFGYDEADLLGWSRLHTISFDQALFNAEVYLRQMFKDKMGDLMAGKDWSGTMSAMILDDGTLPNPSGAVQAGVLAVRQEYDARRDWEAYRDGRGVGGDYGPGTRADNKDANW
jgi:hypothetical protein